MSDEFSFGNTRVERKEGPVVDTSSTDWGDEANFGQTVRPMSTGTKVFNRFTLKSQLGRGGMGVVWLAEDEKKGRDVALKFIPELVRMDETAVSELRRETKRGMQMNHPNIVKVYDLMEDEIRVAIVMEYIEGGTLSRALLQQPSGIFEVGSLREPVDQLLDALEYTHSNVGIYHRDLKPANLMISADRQLKVTDFGIACSLRDSASRVSVKTQASGTLLYMSPQQLMGGAPTASDDIYAVGATLYELLTGKPPFNGGNLSLQLQTKVPPSITERRHEYQKEGGRVPPEWETAIAACLAKEPSGRPADIAALRDALKGKPFSYGKASATPVAQPAFNPGRPAAAGTSTFTSPAYTPPPAPAPSKNKWIVLGATIVVASVVAAIVLLFPDKPARVSDGSVDVRDKQKTDARAKLAEMRQRFDAVSKATAAQSINQNARDWRKLYEEFRDFSTIYSTEDDDLKGRIKKLADNAERQVVEEEESYTKLVDDMKKEGETLIKADENPGRSAPLKQKDWQDFIAKWSAVKIPEVYSAGHHEVMRLAKESEQEWADKSRNERQVTNGLGDLFTEPQVASWRLESKEELLKQVQAKLKVEGVYTDAIDGEYGQKSGNAIVKYQQNKGLPATGKLDKPTLDGLAINRTTEPVQVASSRSTGGAGRSGGSSSGGGNSGAEKAAGWVRAFSGIRGGGGGPGFRPPGFP